MSLISKISNIITRSQKVMYSSAWYNNEAPIKFIPCTYPKHNKFLSIRVGFYLFEDHSWQKHSTLSAMISTYSFYKITNYSEKATQANLEQRIYYWDKSYTHLSGFASTDPHYLPCCHTQSSHM